MAMATTFFKRLRSLRRSIFACSLASDIPRLLLVSMENVPRMVNVLCASIPRGSDIPDKAHSWTRAVATLQQRYPYNQHGPIVRDE